MSDKRATRKRKRKPNLLFILVMGTALMLAGSWSYQLVQTDQAMDKHRLELLQQKAGLIAENEKLRKEIELLNTPSYIEQLARQKLGLVRKGEIMIAPKESETP